MHVSLLAERSIAAAPAAIYALVLDGNRFAPLFQGHGPIPGLDRIQPLGPVGVGAVREVRDLRGAVLHERITALEPSERHAYTLYDLPAPLSWLAREGRAEWRFQAMADDPGATRVSWRYDFELTGPWAWPLAWPVLRGAMQPAMRGCLERIAQALEQAWRAERR